MIVLIIIYVVSILLAYRIEKNLFMQNPSSNPTPFMWICPVLNTLFVIVGFCIVAKDFFDKWAERVKIKWKAKI